MLTVRYANYPVSLSSSRIYLTFEYVYLTASDLTICSLENSIIIELFF